MKTGYRFSHGSDIYSLLDISRRIYLNTEVFEITGESDIRLGIITKNFLIKTHLDLMEPLIKEPYCYSGIDKKLYHDGELDKELGYIVAKHSKIRSVFSGEITMEKYLIDAGRSPPITSNIATTYNFALNNIELNLRDLGNQNYTATMYNLANALELNKGFDMRGKEFLRQGEHIISSLKAGDWLFYL